METPNLKLGFLETISQVLSLQKESLATEYTVINQLLKQADEETFYSLSPHLFVTRDEEGTLIGHPLEATPEGYDLFKHLVGGQI
ncbi:hypothetical protein [Streptococcus sp. S784/96/1]|uniref:hypothetical protein n=1 Tax=Streptococcus sp. S784/96/1 TaxID=2653499 RepID=UPI00138A183F|nr:hypothetical protein [Streptococcus sp. S784/96/1]